MMSSKLLDIQPRELNFTFEVKKQSSCAVHLTNLWDQYIAFKVKTTSPKKYCVRPNIGIIKPNSSCDFTVTMLAQRSAPEDMQCKDKFLIQSTIVPFGSTEEDITPRMFSKDSAKYIEDNKLRVVLVAAPNPPVLVQNNGVPKQEQALDSSIQKEKLLPSGVENFPPLLQSEDVEDIKKDNDEVITANVDEGNVVVSPVKDLELSPVKNVDSELVDEAKLEELNKDVEELKSKLNMLDSELIQAESTISKLQEEKSMVMQEKELLNQELIVLRKKGGVRRVQVGFPFLFVCMVGLISLSVGYLLNRS